MDINVNKAELNRNIKKTYIRYAITTGVLLIIYWMALLLIQKGIMDNYTLRIVKQIGIFMIAALGLNLILGFTGQSYNGTRCIYVYWCIWFSSNDSEFQYAFLQFL